MRAKRSPQGQPSEQQWGEEFSTTGARLLLKETERNRINGRTAVTYSLFVSGLPRNTPYVLWTRLVGRSPQPAADAFLNDEGRVVSQLGIPERGVAEDPINLRVLAGKGEPKEFGLISIDGRFRVFAEVVPFPIQTSNGNCHLSAVMTRENYYGVFVRITGFQPQEDLLIATQSNEEQGQSKAKASDLGEYDSALFPSVAGSRSGKVRFTVSAKSCTIGIQLPWGDGSYELQ